MLWIENNAKNQFLELFWIFPFILSVRNDFIFNKLKFQNENLLKSEEGWARKTK
jgi:hypothetical protein